MKQPDPLSAGRTLVQLREAELEAARQTGDATQLVHAQTMMALALFGAGEVGRGLALFDEGIALARQTGDREVEARCLGNKGIALSEARRFEDALSCLDETLDIAVELELPALRCDALEHLGSVHVELGDPRAGMDFMEQALALANELSDTERRMSIHGNLGNTALLLADLQQARDHFLTALAWASRAGDLIAESGYLNNLGLVYFSAGLLEEAAENFEALLTIARRVEDRDGERSVLKNLLKVYSRLNRPEPLLAHARRSLEIANEDRGVADIIEIEDVVIRALLETNRASEALGLIDGALSVVKERLDPAVYAAGLQTGHRLRLLAHKSEAHYWLGDLPEAGQACEEALGMTTSDVRRGQLLGSLALIRGEEGAVDESISLARQALELTKDSADAGFVGRQQSLLAFAWRDKDRIDLAQHHGEAALQAFTEAEHTEMMAMTRRFLAELQSGGS